MVWLNLFLINWAWCRSEDWLPTKHHQNDSLIAHQRSPSRLSLADERASSITSASIFPILCPRAHLQFQFHSWVSFGFFGIGCRSTSEFLLGLHLTSPRLSWNLSPTPGFFWLSARFKAALHCEAGTSGTSTCKTILSTSTFNNQCWLSTWSSLMLSFPFWANLVLDELERSRELILPPASCPAPKTW